MMQAILSTAAVLIDADNLQDDTWLEAVREQVKQRSGRVPVMRAYGGMARLLSKEKLWLRLGVESVPNLQLEKNTTDSCLIADAVELCLRDGIRLIAIASGDADFAPLAVRLRQWGCEVWCFAVTQTLFKGAELYYDKVVRFQQVPTSPPTTVAAPVQVASVTSPSPSKPAVSLSSDPPTTLSPQQIEDVLKAIPNLRARKALPLSQIVPLLRAKGLIGQKEKPKVWRSRFDSSFQFVTDKGVPNTICYRTAAVAPMASPAQGKPAILQMQEVFPVGGIKVPRSTYEPLADDLHAQRVALWQDQYEKICVADVLLCVPELVNAQRRYRLSDVEGRLRADGLLSPAHSAMKILRKFADSFDVELQAIPAHIRYRG